MPLPHVTQLVSESRVANCEAANFSFIGKEITFSTGGESVHQSEVSSKRRSLSVNVFAFRIGNTTAW